MSGVFIVEDHEDMRLIYRRILGKSGMEVCGEVATAEEALQEIPRAKADLVLIDISLPGLDGIALTKRLRDDYPDLCLLICTGHDVSRYEESADRAGANAIISKEDTHTLLSIVRNFMSGTCG